MKAHHAVLFTGQLQPGVKKADAIQKLVSEFKITPLKAGELLSHTEKKLIKKGLSHQNALAYKKKLTEAGLQIEIQVETTKQPGSVISHEPTKKETQKEKEISSAEHTSPKETQSVYSPPKSNVQKEPADQMKFFGLFGRFALYYLLSTILLGIVVALTGIKGNSTTGALVIFVSVMLACTSFAKKNDRYFTKRERVKATLGFSGINILFQLFFSMILLLGLSKPVNVNIQALLIVLAIPILLHTPLIYFFIWSNGKRMAKRGEVALSG